MLCSDCFSCWSLSAHPLEYWRPPHYPRLHGKHVLASLNPSIPRGSQFCLVRYIFFPLFICYLLDFCASHDDFSSFLGKQQKRVALLMASALFQGASIGPLIELAIRVDSR